MRALWCRLFHMGWHVRMPRYGRFGGWDCSCDKCGREWHEFEP